MGLTPFQTIGPYFQVMLGDAPRGEVSLVDAATRGTRLHIDGVVLDGHAEPIVDALVEIWQADHEGRYRHPADPRAASADPAFPGHGRVATDDRGAFRIDTIKPGIVAAPDDVLHAPHILFSVLARGVLTRYWTRMYFADDPLTASDAILRLVPDARRETLVALPTRAGRYRFDLVLQGPRETVFFDA